jgi:dihydrodipicolinate synthase/N-acetylneuraminate lyase
MTKIGGVIPPLITAFDEKGEVDEAAQRAVVSFLARYVQGLYVCGTYGSGPLMSTRQRKKCAEVVIDEVKGGVPIVLHVGAPSTSECIELSEHAEDIGAQAVAAVPPYYYRHKEDDVKAHFEAIVEAVDLPVYFYNNPSTTGFSATGKFLKELSEVGVSGVKDSSFNILTFYDFMTSVLRDEFNFIMGTEALLLPAVSMGARGCVAGLANAFPEPVVELFNAAVAGDAQKAAALQKKVLIMREIAHYGPTIPVIHALLQERKVNSGHPKAPFREIAPNLRKRILDDLRPHIAI